MRNVERGARGSSRSLRDAAHVMAVFMLTMVSLGLGNPVATAQVMDSHPEFPYISTRYDEALRGQWHFSPRSGWMNDINAPIFYRGQYHLFFQHNPHGLGWDTMHWGHATSPDLMHWTQRPIALEPGMHPGNLWSGGGVVDEYNTSGLKSGDDDPMVVFSGADGVTAAYSTDGGEHFASYERGRVLVKPEGTSRDPKVFWHEPTSRWVMVLWSENPARGVPRGVEIYTSQNLLDWQWRSRYEAPWLFECPDLVSLSVVGSTDRKWVLNDAGGRYVVGSFDGSRFSSPMDQPLRFDHGVNAFDGTIYAGLTFENMPDGRVVQMSWQPGNHGPTWTGNASVPVQLSLHREDGELRVHREPVEELSRLRTRTRTWPAQSVPAGANELTGVDCDSCELDATIDLSSPSARALVLSVRDDGATARRVVLDPVAHTVDGQPFDGFSAPIRVQALVDRGQFELFLNEGAFALTDNHALPGHGLSLVSTAPFEVTRLAVHTMGSAWGTGESTLAGNLAQPFHAVGGEWQDVVNGKQVRAVGDVFYLSSSSASDFSYEGDITLASGDAAALTFRATPDTSQHYSVNLSLSGNMRLWRPGKVLADRRMDVAAGQARHVKVVALGSRIRVYLDHHSTPVIDVVDDTYSSGLLGVNGFNAGAVFNNLVVDGNDPLAATLQTGWTSHGGSWTAPFGLVRGRATGDAAMLSATTASDLDYSAQVRVNTGRAAALVFRSNDDATQHYAATIDTDGLVKLWRPGRVLAEKPWPVRPGAWYDLRVRAVGPDITLWVDGRLALHINDPTYATGWVGLNVFDGTADFRALTLP